MDETEYLEVITDDVTSVSNRPRTKESPEPIHPVHGRDRWFRNRSRGMETSDLPLNANDHGIGLYGMSNDRTCRPIQAPRLLTGTVYADHDCVWLGLLLV